MTAKKSPLQEFMQKNPHSVVVLVEDRLYGPRGGGTWLVNRSGSGIGELIHLYSRKRDAIRALRKAGYRQHGSSWSLPATIEETQPTAHSMSQEAVESTEGIAVPPVDRE